MLRDPGGPSSCQATSPVPEQRRPLRQSRYRPYIGYAVPGHSLKICERRLSGKTGMLEIVRGACLAAEGRAWRPTGIMHLAGGTGETWAAGADYSLPYALDVVDGVGLEPPC